MSRQTANPAMDVLLRTLDIDGWKPGCFAGKAQVGWQRVFGGQVIGQALVAATRTVEQENRFVHSLHAYFVRPGDPSVPILYDVENIRDGGSFATRRVVAIQHGKPIYFMTASFQDDEDGFETRRRCPMCRRRKNSSARRS